MTTLVESLIVFGKASRADARDAAGEFEGTVHIVRIHNTLNLKVAEDPVSYLVVPEGQACPCCGGEFKGAPK